MNNSIKLLIICSTVIVIFFVKMQFCLAEKITITGEWECGNGTKELYDTPLGKVYRFKTTKNYRYSYKDSLKSKSPDVHGLFFSAFKSGTDYKKEMKRFCVLDFSVRVFPAESRRKNADLYFTLVKGNKDNAKIKNYMDINSTYSFIEKCFRGWQNTQINSVYTKRTRQPLKNSYWAFSAGLPYVPHYETASFRFIWDSDESGISASNINGSEKVISQNHLKYVKKMPFYSFGILLQNYKSDSTKFRNILEVSEPVLTLVDNESELKQLKPLKIKDYPYDEYPEDFKSIKKSRNPDALYAYAMRQIDNGNLPEGIKLLKKAEKDKHLFAMYQLGVCYFRGIGVKKALIRQLRISKKLPHINVRTQSPCMLWH